MKRGSVCNLLAPGLISLAMGNSPLLAQNALGFVIPSQVVNLNNVHLAQVDRQYTECTRGFGYCLQLGDRGSLVYELIEDLRRAGYYNVGNDSYFGPVTDRAVRNFQRDAGLTPDGIVGTQTRNLLPNPRYWKNSSGRQILPIPGIYGLEYNQARKKVIGAGWQPRRITRESYSVEYGNGPMLVEQGYQELIFCSGTGLAPCFFEFVDAYGNYLLIRTIGQGSNPAVENFSVYDLPFERRD
ncbi:MAG: peptidoglycan-binding domain-containing protein [Oscillatoria sp. PMC 1068.18]|nr:peptidoglycan-binding domain-containing protein [Oscillatoria sp. PMC 1076.18]MEC4987973.1 peptidoglycan-binding domain-containing protein [Oscillatoria sp. PMC 1068.18]